VASSIRAVRYNYCWTRSDDISVLCTFKSLNVRWTKMEAECLFFNVEKTDNQLRELAA